MKKVILLVGLITVLFLLAGCDEGKRESERGYSDRYSIPNMKTLANDTYPYDYFYVIDKSTGVVYLQFSGDRQAGITVVLNADGTPVTVEQLEMNKWDSNFNLYKMNDYIQ